MKNSVYITIVFVIICVSKMYSQDLSVKWSDIMEYNEKVTGYMDNYLGVNDKYVYALFTDDPLKNMDYQIHKMKITAFDKSTMQKVSSVSIKGFKENNEDIAEQEKHDLLSIHIKKNLIYVFWTKINDHNHELFLSTYDIELNKIKSSIKVKSVDIGKDMMCYPGMRKKTLFTVLTNASSQDIIIGWEDPQKDNFTKFYYGKLGGDLQVEGINQVNLPIKLKDMYYGRMGRYDYLDNGDILINTSATTENKGNTDIVVEGGIKITNLNVYFTMSYLRTDDVEISTVALPDRSLYAKDLKYSLSKNYFRLYGLYCNLEKDPKSKSLHGIFSSTLNFNDYKFSEINYKEFDKLVLDSLFRKSKDHPLNEISNTDQILIDTIINISDDTELLVFSNNHSVSLMSFNSNMEIDWISKFYRDQIGYGSNNIYEADLLMGSDINYIRDENKLILVYDEDYIKSTTRMGLFIKKLGYKSIDLSNGNQTQIKLLDLNEDSPKEEKDVNPHRGMVFENQLYIFYLDLKKEIGAIGKISIE